MTNPLHSLTGAARRAPRRTLAALAALAVLGGGGVALAHASAPQAAATQASPAPTLTFGDSHAPEKKKARKPGYGVGDLIKLEAKVTGLTTTQIQSDLESGESLNAIAGSNAQAVVTQADAAIAAKISAAVAAGTVTQAHGQKLQAALQTKLTAVMAEPGQQVLAALKKGGGHGMASPAPSPAA